MRRLNLIVIILFLSNTALFYLYISRRTTKETNQLLTHLVVPLHIKQKTKLKAFFDHWRKYPPCIKHSSRLSFNPPLAHKVTLVLQVSSESEITALDRYELTLHIPRECKCIKNVEIKEMILNNDSYLVGSRVMFEALLTNQLELKEPRYIFQMEPDCRPIRPGWLQAVDASIRWPNAPFWMKGSHFRGQASPSLASHLIVRSHINGNAIFNVHDQEFGRFYYTIVKPFIAKNYNVKGSAYDLDFYRLFLNSTAAHYPLFQPYLQKFQYSEVIQNYWHSTFNISQLLDRFPETFIIHGGNED